MDKMFYLSHIKIDNYRAFSSFEQDFKEGINIIHGPNASGKTSIVEAIGYLGLCKSFKNSKDANLVKIKESYFSICGKFVENEDCLDLIASFVNGEKAIKRNNIQIKKISDYIGEFIVLSFIPDDLDIAKGYPQERRRFLNVNISQLNKDYFGSLSRYNKILKLRNAYLKDNNNIDMLYLDAISSKLVLEGKKIIKYRNEFINSIDQYVNSCAISLSKGKEKIKLVYNPNINEDKFEDELKKAQNYDVLNQTTSVGPHKDDFYILINGKEASKYGSQGQIRTAIISLKMGLSKYLKSLNKNQLIILDDVFSELDTNRQEEMLLMLDQECQIFITTTNIEHINKEILNKSNLIEMRKEENE